MTCSYAAAARRGGVICLMAILVPACSVISRTPGAVDASGKAVSTVIPAQQLNISRTLSLSPDAVILGAALYWAIDPLAPNWQLQHAPLGANSMRISLRKKRFTSGGDGEAAQLFARRAEQLARDGGYAGYTVMEYTEGVESALPVAQRVAQGVVRLNR